MIILIVDDEEYLREDLRDALERVSPGNEYFFASEYNGAMKLIDKTAFDIAFLDIQMPGKNGLALAEIIKKKCPKMNIVMVTAYSEYALDALKLFVSGYILKPVMDDDLKEVLDNLRNPVDGNEKEKSIAVKCFGNFEVYVGEKAVKFSRAKGKELFAYLVCLRGTSATRGEICANIFEESNEKKAFEHLKKAVQSLKKDLSKYHLEDVLEHSRNAYSVNIRQIQCDYYDYLDRKPEARDLYRGVFLNQYSWAETYIYHLENL